MAQNIHMQLEMPIYFTTIGKAVVEIVPKINEPNVMVAIPIDLTLVGKSSLTAPTGIGPIPIEYDKINRSILPIRNHE